MTSPFSAGVLSSAAALTSPALYHAFVTGTLPIDVALTRYLLAVVVCWLVLCLVIELVPKAPGTSGPAVPASGAVTTHPMPAEEASTDSSSAS